MSSSAASHLRHGRRHREKARTAAKQWRYRAIGMPIWRSDSEIRAMLADSNPGGITRVDREIRPSVWDRWFEHYEATKDFWKKP